jgi:hypothetical protein
VSLTKIQEFIDMGRLKVKENEMITMHDLYMAGVATGIDDGIKLLAGVCISLPCMHNMTFINWQFIYLL